MIVRMWLRVVVVVVVGAAVCCQGSFEDDREALISLYLGLGGSDWTNNANWTDNNRTENFDLSTWHGVTTSSTGVKIINLDDNNLVGELPELEEGQLSELQFLRMRSNKISGTLPASLQHLRNLTSLDMGENELEGDIPPEIGSISSLGTLELDNNGLSGNIPRELANAQSLTNLVLNDNRLGGFIPSELGTLSFLRTLNLGGNLNLEGPIPMEIGTLTQLQHLNLSGNSLSGEIATEFGSLAVNEGDSLSVDFSNNFLSGVVPAGLVQDNLLSLDLSGNYLKGQEQRADGKTAAPYVTPTVPPTPHPTVTPTPSPTVMRSPEPTVPPTVALPSTASTSAGAPASSPERTASDGDAKRPVDVTVGLSVTGVTLLLFVVGVTWRKKFGRGSGKRSSLGVDPNQKGPLAWCSADEDHHGTGGKLGGISGGGGGGGGGGTENVAHGAGLDNISATAATTVEEGRLAPYDGGSGVGFGDVSGGGGGGGGVGDDGDDGDDPPFAETFTPLATPVRQPPPVGAVAEAYDAPGMALNRPQGKAPNQPLSTNQGTFYHDPPSTTRLKTTNQRIHDLASQTTTSPGMFEDPPRGSPGVRLGALGGDGNGGGDSDEGDGAGFEVGGGGGGGDGVFSKSFALPGQVFELGVGGEGRKDRVGDGRGGDGNSELALEMKRSSLLTFDVCGDGGGGGVLSRHVSWGEATSLAAEGTGDLPLSSLSEALSGSMPPSSRASSRPSPMPRVMSSSSAISSVRPPPSPQLIPRSRPEEDVADGNVDKVLHGVRVAAKVAQNSSVVGVAEVGALVEALVGFAEDNRDIGGTFDKSRRLCSSLVTVLQKGEKLLAHESAGGDGSILLKCVQDDLKAMVDMINYYQGQRYLPRLWKATMYKKRHEEAEASVVKLLFYLNTELSVNVLEQVTSMKDDFKGLASSATTISEVEARRQRREKLIALEELPQDSVRISENLIGSGGSGKVYLADFGGLKAAAKVLIMDGDDDASTRKQQSAFLVELQHMRRLKSPHIVRFFGIITSIERQLVLVMEFLPGGNLFKFVERHRDKGPIEEETARRIIRDIAEGMAFLHGKKTWHGDLKSLNVLLDADDRAKISDFGTSHCTEHTKSRNLQTAPGSMGGLPQLSYRWAAPEVLDDGRSFNEQLEASRDGDLSAPGATVREVAGALAGNGRFMSDVYSFGVVVWEVLSRQVPWGDCSIHDMFLKVVMRKERLLIPVGAIPDLASLVRRCCVHTPEERPSFDNIISGLRPPWPRVVVGGGGRGREGGERAGGGGGEWEVEERRGGSGRHDERQRGRGGTGLGSEGAVGNGTLRY